MTFFGVFLQFPRLSGEIYRDIPILDATPAVVTRDIRQHNRPTVTVRLHPYGGLQYCISHACPSLSYISYCHLRLFFVSGRTKIG